MLVSLVLVLLIGHGTSASREDTVLHIGGIFPIAGEGGWQGGQVSLFVIFCEKILFCYYFLKKGKVADNT